MANEHQVNAQPHPSPKDMAAHAKAATSPVWISQQALGPPVSQVKQSTPSSNNLYWMFFSNNKVIHSVVFRVTFKPGSPLHDQTQTFTFPGGYGGNIETPFGVPYWGGNLILGPAVLSVLADGHPAGTYNFTVVP
jgi:hypothetical protein